MLGGEAEAGADFEVEFADFGPLGNDVDQATGGAEAIHRRAATDNLDLLDGLAPDRVERAAPVAQGRRLRHAVDQRQEGAAAQRLAEIGVGLGALAEAGHLLGQDVADIVVDATLFLHRLTIHHGDRTGGFIYRCFGPSRRLEHDRA